MAAEDACDRGGVVGQICHRRRRAAEFGRIGLLEAAARGWIRGGVPGTSHLAGTAGRICPQGRSHDLHRRAVDIVVGQDGGDLGQRIAGVCQQQRIEAWRRDRRLREVLRLTPALRRLQRARRTDLRVDRSPAIGIVRQVARGGVDGRHAGCVEPHVRRGSAPLADAAWIRACAMAWPKSLSGSSPANCDLPCPCAAATSRRTCCPGVIPSVQTPGCACDGSLVKASTATFAARAIGATAAVSDEVSGPRISPAPSAIAAWAAAAAPWGVPPVSFASSGGAPDPSSASCAACSIDWPRSARAPDSGSRIATVCPVGHPAGGRRGIRCPAGPVLRHSRR